MAAVHRFEVLVVGAGLAGLTAGLFAARQGRATLVFESTAPGGHLLNVHAYPNPWVPVQIVHPLGEDLRENPRIRATPLWG